MKIFGLCLVFVIAVSLDNFAVEAAPGPAASYIKPGGGGFTFEDVHPRRSRPDDVTGLVGAVQFISKNGFNKKSLCVLLKTIGNIGVDEVREVGNFTLSPILDGLQVAIFKFAGNSCSDADYSYIKENVRMKDTDVDDLFGVKVILENFAKNGVNPNTLAAAVHGLTYLFGEEFNEAAHPIIGPAVDVFIAAGYGLANAIRGVGALSAMPSVPKMSAIPGKL